MEDNILLCTLFDYYGELLTERQIEYFKDYYFDNLTLGEISENNNISRNAVHKTLKEAVDRLQFYEDKLNLVYKSKKVKELISDLEEDLKERIMSFI